MIKFAGIHTNENKKREFYVIGDTSYSACCIDDVIASHAKANDTIIKFGSNHCLSTNSKSKIR